MTRWHPSRTGALVGAAIELVLTLAAGEARAAAGGAADYIVVLRDQADPLALVSEARARGIETGFVYAHAVHGAVLSLTPAERAVIERRSDVLFVAPDSDVESAALTPIASGDSAPTGVRRIGAATTNLAQQRASTAIAIVDSGIDLTHPDLNAHNGANCLHARRPALDDNGHGTHVAGIAGAANNGTGVVGVAPGTPLYAVKVLDRRGSGRISRVVCGLDWVAANATTLGIAVVNLSLSAAGGDDGACGAVDRDALHRAVCGLTNQGITVVAAAGNDGSDLRVRVPAAYREVIAVTAMVDTDGAAGGLGPPPCSPSQRDDSAWTISNFALSSVDAQRLLAAPGLCVLSTAIGGGYGVSSGTSEAAPHVAAAAALCIGTANGPGPCAGATPSAIRDRLRADAAARPASEGFAGDERTPSAGQHFGYLVWAGY